MATFYFKRNLPGSERALRLLAGVLLGGLVYGGAVTGWLSWLLLASAATLGLTAFVGFCPACALFGRRSLERRA